MDGIPTNLRDFGLGLIRNKVLYFFLKNTQTRCIIFFRVGTHQLHPQADAQKGLLCIKDQFVQPSLFQIVHGRTGLSYSGKDDFVGGENDFRIIRKHWLYAKALQCKLYRPNIAGIVFDNNKFNGFS